nr:flagellar biosynthesis protein FlgB [Loktanella fryxellensis]
MARHAGSAQAQIARNIAHADTPDFRASRLADFASTVNVPAAPGMKATRALHVLGHPDQPTARLRDTGNEASPNGNTVSVEEELFASARAGSDHRRALAIYRHAMTVIRSSLGR